MPKGLQGKAESLQQLDSLYDYMIQRLTNANLQERPCRSSTK